MTVEYRCLGVLYNGNQCKVAQKLTNLYCKMHEKQDPYVEIAKCIRCDSSRVKQVRPKLVLGVHSIMMQCHTCDKQWEIE